MYLVGSGSPGLVQAGLAQFIRRPSGPWGDASTCMGAHGSRGLVVWLATNTSWMPILFVSDGVPVAEDLLDLRSNPQESAIIREGVLERECQPLQVQDPILVVILGLDSPAGWRPF